MNTKPGNTASRYNPIYITSFLYIVHCTTSSIYNCNFDNSLLFTSKVSAYAARYDTKTILNNQTIFAFSYRSWLFQIVIKLDRVGPVDNRPSTDELHNFFQKKCERKKCDAWHVTHGMWHVIYDMGHVVGVIILSKLLLPSSWGLWFMMFWRFCNKSWPTS